MWPFTIARDLVRVTPFVVELHRVPFAEQKLIAIYIIDRLPKFQYGAVDAGGNGAAQAEALRRKYSEQRIEEVKLSPEWYRVNMPRFKSAFEGASLIIPKDLDIRTDLEAIVMDKGIAKVPNNAETEGADGELRHGDSAIAAALAWYASEKTPTPMEHHSTGKLRASRQVADFMGGLSIGG
jgi:phage FluMu gp28-like protein